MGRFRDRPGHHDGPGGEGDPPEHRPPDTPHHEPPVPPPGEKPPPRRWYEFELDETQPEVGPRPPDAPDERDGRRHCGPLEGVLHRQWPSDTVPMPEMVTAVDRLAELPEELRDKLAHGLRGIWLGHGAVPELDDLGRLRGMRLPGVENDTWDVIGGTYWDRQIAVGDQPTGSVDTTLHEVGHALDDLDGGLAVQDEFRSIYAACLPRLTNDFYRLPGDRGPMEFFAEAFAALASGNQDKLIDLLGGDTATAVTVWSYLRERYGIG